MVTLSSSGRGSKSDEAEHDEVCWICHEAHSATSPLASPCNCRAMKAHKPCLARWQLQSAGKPEERRCRFCLGELPDWREAHADLPKSSPVMTVVHNGVSHSVSVGEGPGGKEAFERAIRRIYSLAETDAVVLSFGCRIPGSEHEVVLEGWEAYDAAVHCAAISAGQRRVPPPQRPSDEGGRPSSGRAPGMLRRMFSRRQQN